MNLKDPKTQYILIDIYWIMSYYKILFTTLSNNLHTTQDLQEFACIWSF